MLIMKRIKRQITGGIEQPNHKRIRTLRENKIYKYFEILKANTIKQTEMKEKSKKTVSQTNEKSS